MPRVLKWEVAVDGEPHEVGAGPALHVACQGGNPTIVYVWTAEDDRTLAAPPPRARAFGTGHEVPEDAVYLGTAVADPFVWHLFREA